MSGQRPIYGKGESPMKKDIFISYSSKEASIAYTVKEVLEENGISCWMAPESIAPGANYLEEIPEGIKNSQLFLLLLSQSAQESTWVLKELSQAASFGKTIIPFMVKKCDINTAFSFALSSSQRLDAYEKTSEKLEELVVRIKGILSVESKAGVDEPAEEQVGNIAETKPKVKFPFFGGKRNVFVLILSALVSIPMAVLIAHWVTSGEEDMYCFLSAGNANRYAVFLGLMASLTVMFGKLCGTRLMKWCYWLDAIAIGVMYTEFCRNMEEFGVALYLMTCVIWFFGALILFLYFDESKGRISCGNYLGNAFFCLAVYPLGFILYVFFSKLLKFSESLWLTITSVLVFVAVLIISWSSLDYEFQ